MVLIGCAAPGEPAARHPVIPQPVTDLSVRQQGDGAVLTFTLPANSTDKKPLNELPTVDIYRAATPPGGAAANKPAMRLVDTIPADRVDAYKKDRNIEFRDDLDPAELQRQPGEQLTYTVRTRVSGDRASADSNLARLRVYLAPQPVGELREKLAEKAIDLTWAPSAGEAPPTGVTGAYRIYRAEIAPDSAAAAAQDPSKAVLRGPLRSLALVHTPAYEDVDISTRHAYLYLVRAVSQFGEDTVESLDSNEVIVTAIDIFPPAAPQNLVAVIIPETSEAPAYVELSWSISPEPDLAGYTVYRSDQPDTPGERLNSELLPAPTFRDTDVKAGQRYFYHVRAVDRSGNESPFSAAAEADLAGH